VPLQVTSATYTITGAAPFNGIFTTGFTPPVGASTTSNATYPTYPPAAEVGPFPVAGRYRLTWTTISYNAAGVNRTLTNCGISDSTVSDVPYLRAYGNDVVTCDLPGTADYNGEIRASGTYVGSPSNQANWRGSASELAFFAAGRVRGFMPGAMRNRPSTIALSFANVAGTFATNGSQNFGGRFGGGCEIRELPDPTGFSSGGNLGQLNSLDGRYQRTANTTIATSPSLSITNRNIVIYVAGDVTIANNITYNTGTWNIDTIPSVKVFATGNIYIRPGVTQLDGEYVAGGQLLTCATTSSFPSDATINSSCRTPLVINGNIKAQRIHYLRAVGSLLSGTSFEGHASPNIAESIRFSPDAYLLPDGGGLAPDPGGSPPYDSIIARPPTF